MRKFRFNVLFITTGLWLNVIDEIPLDTRLSNFALTDCGVPDVV